MAKQVENIVVRLGLERFEGLDKIKSSFRDLGKVTKLTESDILDARTAIFDFAKDAGNTEAVVDGLKSALTGLRSQADLCGTAYNQLTQDLRQLSEVQQGATVAAMRNRDELVRNFSETTRNIRALREHRDALIAIQAETRQYSRTYDVLSNDIALVRERITEVTAVAKGLNVALSRAFPATAAGVRATLANINEGIQLQRDIINEIDLRTSKERKLASSLAERAQAERLLNNALVAQQQLSFGERVRAGRESVRVAAEAFNAPTMTGGYYSAENIGRRMGALPNTVAGLNQELSELSERLANTTRGSSTYIDVAIRMAQIQKELKTDVMGTAEAFRRLSLAEEGVERRAGKVSAVQDYYATQGPTAPGVGGFRDPQTGAIIARGAYDPNRIRVQEQAYPQPIGPVEYSGIAKDAIADRKQEIRQRIDNLRAITQENAALREQNAIRRSIARGRARTNRDAPIPTQMRDISSLYQQIGQIGMQPIISDIERMGNSYDTVANDIRRATAASNNSVQSLQTQRSAWQALLSQLDPASTAFRATSREIEKLDARLAKVQRSRRLSGMQLAQGAGAVVSGGIFGGPEGFLGGAAGLALGGVGGAFAGAAFGAQVGMLRKALGTTAEYAAQIQKSKIALEGAAGNQQEFNRALRAADDVTRRLNVPQEIAVQGMTKLAAAVKGAGGQVSDAELVLKNVTAAIKATGGSAQDVDGAITAMVQVFSKGKVSAEELSGQLGERLPGAVTKFAEANNMTLPELQKGLEQGQIGLYELMNFIVKLGEDYTGVAEKISASSEDAGSRLNVAFNDMRLSVGAAIQPLGAELQTAFAAFITDITPAVVASVKDISTAFEFFSDNKVAAGIGSFALKLGAVALAVAGVRAAFAKLSAINISAWFTGASASAKITGDTMVAVSSRAAGLLTVLKSLAAIGAITIVVDIFIKNYMQLMAAKEALDKLRNQRDPVGSQGPRPVMTAERRYAGASREKVIQDIELQREYVAKLRQKLKTLESEIRVLGSVRGTGSFIVGTRTTQAELLKQQIKDAEEVINLDIRKFKTREQIEQDYLAGVRRRFAAPTAEDAGAKDKATSKAKSDADSIAAHQQRLAETALDQRLRFEDAIYKHGVELDRKRYELQKNLEDLQAQNRIARETGATRDYLSKFYQLQQDLQAIAERRSAAQQAVADAKRAASSAAARAALSAQMPPSVSGAISGVYRQGNIGPTSTGPHFDIKQVGGGYFDRAALDPYVRVNGAPLSRGTTVPGGEFYARREGRPHHGGWDYAFSAGAGLSLTGGAKWMGTSKTAHGDETAFMTPDGKVYKILHGRFEPAAVPSAKLPTGVPAQQIRATKQRGAAEVEQADVAHQEQLQKLEQQFAYKQEREAYEKFQLSVTENLRMANAELEDNNKLQALNNRLSIEGFSPERIELETKIEGRRLEQQRMAAGYEKAVALVRQDSTLTVEEQNAKIAELTNTQTAYNSELERLIQLYKDSASLAEAGKSPVAIIGAAIGRLKTEIADLTNIGNIAVSVADTISSAFGTAFSNLTSGSMSVGEALGQMFKDIGNQFVQMAIQIISKQMTLIILQIIFNALRGGGGGFSFGGSSGGFNLPGFKMPGYMSGATIPAPGTFAKGGAFAKNGVVPFAYGGVVNKPTLFQFAKGGTAATGLMGEAGPEAIMPLRRGSDGRLGVEANGLRQAMGPAPGLSSQSTVLNMSFETSTINGVEYVSRDQLEAAMEQTRRDAARSGAQRGMTMTLDRLQQSPNTRRRVGI